MPSPWVTDDETVDLFATDDESNMPTARMKGVSPEDTLAAPPEPPAISPER